MTKRNYLLAAAIGSAFLGAATSVLAEDDAGDSPVEGYKRTGEMSSCLSRSTIRDIDPISDKVFVVRTGVNKYYLNEVNGRCSRAASGFTFLKYRTSGSSLCRNEIINVVENTNGTTVGSCSLGSFERLEKVAEEPAE